VNERKDVLNSKIIQENSSYDSELLKLELDPALYAKMHRDDSRDVKSSSSSSSHEEIKKEEAESDEDD
jgi:hypothetical protein